MKGLKIFFNSLLIILIPISLLLLFDYSINKAGDERLFTIEECKGFVIDTDRRMSFNLYSNMKRSLIDNENLNTYTLSLNDFNIELNNPSIEVIKANDYYIHRLECDVPELTDSEITGRAFLKIVNSSFSCSLELGVLSILNKSEYKLLSISHLSVSDSYVDKHLIICGLNIGFTDSYTSLNNLRIGGIGYGRLDLAKEGLELPPVIKIKEIIPEYKVTEIKDSSLSLQASDYFIPICYNRPILLRESYITMELDGERYYLDSFTYKTQAPDLCEYQDKILEGKFVYA